MKTALRGALTVGLLLVLVGLAVAQEPTYLLKEYMPLTVGSKWIMKTMGRQGETTNTIEVGEPKEIQAQQAFTILTKDAQGELIRGSLEAATDNAYYIFGQIRVPRQQGGAAGEPVTTIYDPMLVFPAKMTVGQSADATTKTTMRDQAVEIKVTLQLAAVENVTVPKGTFENCLKLVSTTKFGDRGERTSTMWYAKGVGLVKTEQPGFGQNATPRVAELLEYVPAPPPAQ